MPKNSHGKKKQNAGLTRFELARALACGLTSVDRLIAHGLKTVGRRGPAKLYRRADAMKLARRLAPVSTSAADVLVNDYRTHAEDFADRRQTLRATWIADDAWRPVWATVVLALGRLTAEAVDTLVMRLGTVVDHERRLLGAADGPRPAPPTPRRHLTPEDVVTLLDGDPAAWPWRAPAAPILRGLVADGLGVELLESGSWYRWNPADGHPVALEPPAPVLRPVLQNIADAIGRDPALTSFVTLFDPPAREDLPPMPMTPDEARAQWREARAAYRRVRVAVRRGHHRRAELVEAFVTAAAEFRARWWTARGELPQVAGDRERVRLWAAKLRQATVTEFSKLGGLSVPLPIDDTPAPIGRRRKAA